MNPTPIFVVVDDSDDQEFVKMLWSELKYENPLLFFENSEEVLNQLKTNPVTPFLILCDVNIHKMNGFELKETIQRDQTIKYKSIPFVFWSTKASNEQIKKAYDLGGNGFFIKENNIGDLKNSFVRIVEYWIKSQVPV